MQSLAANQSRPSPFLGKLILSKACLVHIRIVYVTARFYRHLIRLNCHLLDCPIDKIMPYSFEKRMHAIDTLFFLQKYKYDIFDEYGIKRMCLFPKK